MSNVVAFPVPADYRDILERLKGSKDIAHLVVVVERKDGLSEIYYDRQPINGVVFAAAVLNSLAVKMAGDALED